MGKALYRKYRSRSLSDVVGQAHITDTLHQAIDSKQVSHAYLFTGPRGVGKTSVARILAHQINGLPYSDESVHLDIIEIDAASNRRIDEIRDLKDKVHIAPTSAKYKVYIIDEVHMLTKEAFNALLKTLEEPPEHAVFILATTEAHKLPDTIISRTQRHTFKPVERGKVVDHLQYIASEEKIDITEEALGVLADHGEGSFRDSISLLDQMRGVSTKIDVADIRSALGLASDTIIQKTIRAVDSGDRQKIEEVLQEIADQGTNIVSFAHQLSTKLRADMVTHNSITDIKLQLLEELSELGASADPQMALTIALYRPLATHVRSTLGDTTPSAPVEHAGDTEEETGSSKYDTAGHEDKQEEPATAPEPSEKADDQLPDREEQASEEDTGNEWELILNATKGHHNTLYGVVRMAQPRFTDTELILEFEFPFHKRRMKDDKNRRLIEDIIHKQLGKRLKVMPTVAGKKSKAQKTPKQSPKMKENKDIKNISNIFGDAEIVES